VSKTRKSCGASTAKLRADFVDAWHWRTQSNISVLYELDAFDWTVLILYFAILGVLAVYGAYRIKQVADFWRYRHIQPAPKRASPKRPARHHRPTPALQRDVRRRATAARRHAVRLPARADGDSGLDDSTDETVALARRTVERISRRGLRHTLHPPQRPHRLQSGRARQRHADSAKGELLAIFDADFVPKPDCLRKLVDYFTDPLVGCAQMRWSHINGAYNLLTRLQTIMLDGHFVIEQTVRNRTGGFFNFNGTAGIWRRRAIELSGGWQHDTLTEDTDLSFRAQLMGWRFIYLLDEDAPSEIPVEINAFKAQQRRWAKGVMQVGIKLYPRIWRANLPLRVRLEMFFRLTGNISYPLMIVASFLQFPLLLVRYNQGFYHLMAFDVPLLFFSTVSVILFYGSAIWYLDKEAGSRPSPAASAARDGGRHRAGLLERARRHRGVDGRAVGVRAHAEVSGGEDRRTRRGRRRSTNASAACCRSSNSASPPTSSAPCGTPRTCACGARSRSSSSSSSATATSA
jgi:cellulose synthase/poly-beta-1,6-N-acetylglucosamine synthase-like glycosyltransferase